MIDSEPNDELYSKVAYVLQNGLRTSTYKLATMSAIIDFSLNRHLPRGTNVLDVPLNEIAQRVMALYWNQLMPPAGMVVLRQSTQPQSRIFNKIEALRSAADCPEDDQTFTTAAKLAPAVFRRAVDDVGVHLAQQPLPRLQRVPGAPRSDTFLYDDSFLHDNVTRTELARHRNCIRLKPGVAEGLARNGPRLLLLIQSIWVDDVLRINRIPAHHRARIENHLFGMPLNRQPAATLLSDPAAISMSTFATRLNNLVSAQTNFSSEEIAAKMRRAGFSMTVGTLTRLQAGVGPQPSKSTIVALARFFKVDPAYFTDEKESAHERSARPNHQQAINHGDPAQTSPTSIGPQANPESDQRGNRADTDDNWGNVFDADLAQISSACEIRPNGCWIRSTNTQIRCRPPGDTGKSFDFPKMGLHRWAWLVYHGYSRVAIPTNRLHVTRTCKGATCCNPQHLFATSPNGGPLSRTAIDALVRSLPGSSKLHHGPESNPFVDQRLVLQANLASIKNYCSINNSGCWLLPTSGPVACRPHDDFRPDGELRRMEPHRWVWMVANGRSSNPLPDAFYVRRRCGEAMCCRLEHLYLTTAQGEEVTLGEAEAILADDERPVREPSAAEQPSRAAQLLARNVNTLFEQTKNPDGVPVTSREVAADLQEEGFAISEKVIDRLRSGSSELPAAQTIGALAYYFNVDIDFFSADAPLTAVNEGGSPDTLGQAKENPTISSALGADNDVDVSLTDIGVLVANLSATISDRLVQDPTDHHVSERLIPLLRAIADVLAAQTGDVAVPRSLLQRIVREWKAIPGDTLKQKALDRLSGLADYSPAS